MRKRAMAVAAALMAGGFVVATGTPSAAITEPVDIRVEHDLVEAGSGPRVLEVTDAVPVLGPEITVANEIDNPSGWGGNVLVDIDPDADTITVEVEDDNCYDTVLVEITTSQVASISTVSDDLFDPSGSPVTLSSSVAGGVVTLSWVSDASDCPSLNDVGATAVFAYELVDAAAPEATLAPAAAQAGTPVTVTGNLCPSGPIMATIAPEGGAPLVDDLEQTVADVAGDWSFDIPTTGLAPGEYTVAVRCVQADLQGFDYEVLAFTVTAAPVDAPPAPPAQPAPAAPTFTG